jgi:hypothetical protein
MLKRHKMFYLTIAVGLMAFFGVSFTAAVPATASVPTITCNYLNPILCLNRSGGGITNGTHVLGYTRSFSDNNEDFQFDILSNFCDAGHVSNSKECPFTPGGGLNREYNGDPIYQLNSYSTGSCVATSASGGGILGTCQNDSGKGGSDGTIFVLSTESYLVNLYWSDNVSCGDGVNPCWMCVYSNQTQVTLRSSVGQRGPCQWEEETEDEAQHGS